MLEYLSEIMEDANDFSWQSAKASHAVLLCRMEEEKVEWHETHKLDQNLGGLDTKQSRFKPKTTACRFFQRGLCHHQKDHETGGVFYKHICSACFAMGKNRHMVKDCRASSRVAKND